MLVALLIVGAQSLTLRGLRNRLEALQHHAARNASNASMDWGSYMSNYCGEFCQMKGTDAGRCTVCEQRMNFSVAEGHVACAVECQGKQTDEVSESDVDCAKRLDDCMFKYIEKASCRLECGADGATASCPDECSAFKTAARAEGEYYSTFFGRNIVNVTSMENVTEQVEVNGTMTNTTVQKEVVSKEVQGVEPLPVASPGERLPPVKSDFRFHQNESAWLKHASSYCATYFCNFEHVDSYLCVECPNRLNNSVEHSLMACRVGCEMHHTDNVAANATSQELACDSDCMTTAFETATCALECEMQNTGSTCRSDCNEHKANQRATGKTGGPESTVTPFFWPDPPKNATNGSNATF